MFCTQCGNPFGAADRFCSRCGHARPDLSTGGAALDTHSVPLAPPGQPSEDWRTTLNYRNVIGHPDVKAMIAEATRNSKAGTSAEDFMKMMQPILDASGAGAVPVKLISELAQPMYAKLGVKTGKEMRQGYSTPFGRTLAAILCSMASRNQTLTSIDEAQNGCILHASLPSSLTAFKGNMDLTLEQKPEGTLLLGAVTIPGQASDWGRSKRTLEELHQDILNYRTLQP